jgi:hypothetical protein
LNADICEVRSGVVRICLASSRRVARAIRTVAGPALANARSVNGPDALSSPTRMCDRRVRAHLRSNLLLSPDRALPNSHRVTSVNGPPQFDGLCRWSGPTVEDTGGSCAKRQNIVNEHTLSRRLEDVPLHLVPLGPVPSALVGSRPGRALKGTPCAYRTQRWQGRTPR